MALSSFDLRTRHGDVGATATIADLPGLVADAPGERLELATRAFRGSGLDAFTVAVDGQSVTWRLTDRSVLEVVDSDVGDGPRADLSAEWLTDIVADRRSAVAVMISAEPVMTRGRVEHLIAWEPTLRALVDGRPPWQPGSVGFTDPGGAPLDLERDFSLDDDLAEMTHFLGEAGFLVVRDVFSAEEMSELDAEMDEWFARMTPDDDRAWYATVGDRRECVRVTNLERSALRFPFAPRLGPIAVVAGGTHTYGGTDLLRKPVGVTEGISDLPWHKDCELGGHSWRCTSLTCGVSVTSSGPDNGRLGVVAGSHRVNIGLFDVGRVDLPQVFPSTRPGDVTVHLSCTLHCATPPEHSERRVTYSSFRLPGSADDLDDTIKGVRDQAGRETYAPSDA